MTITAICPYSEMTINKRQKIGKSNSSVKTFPVVGSDVLIKSKMNYDNVELKEIIQDPIFLQETFKVVMGEKSNNKDAVLFASYLKNPENALDFFMKAQTLILPLVETDNDPIGEFFEHQLESSITNLKKCSTMQRSVAFCSNNKIKNIFNQLKVGTDESLKFKYYFPVDALNLDEDTFNSKVFNILMDEKKKEKFVEVLNSELSKVSMSDELNRYIKEEKSRQMSKIASGVLGSSGVGPLLLTAKAIFNYNNKNKDDFDKTVECIRLSSDMLDLLVTGGAVATLAAFNAKVAALNTFNPEPASKITLWVGNGLIALACISVRAVVKESRARDEAKIIEALKYVKAIHICLQARCLNPMKLKVLIDALEK